MQTIAHTPAHAQHIPDGWSFPTLSPAVPPTAAPVRPVTGGGATAAATVTRVRWGRVLPMLAGIGLLAFGIWNVTHGDSARTGGTGTSNRTVTGGGTSEVEVSDASTSKDSTPEDGAATTPATKTPAATAPAATAPAVAPPGDAAAPKAPAATGARAGTNRAGRAPRTGNRVRRGAGAAVIAPGTAHAATVPRTRSGGGAAEGELPLTGIETWIAGILGVLLLGVGIVVHVSAVRIATTAMLYRRGILLRPTDCARLVSQGAGLDRTRVWMSNLLHRLLEEPAGGSDFVSTRHAI